MIDEELWKLGAASSSVNDIVTVLAASLESLAVDPVLRVVILEMKQFSVFQAKVHHMPVLVLLT